MANIGSRDFNTGGDGTFLTSLGNGWVKATGFTADLMLSGGRVVESGFGSHASLYNNQIVPSSADYSVSADLLFATIPPTASYSGVSLLGRQSSSANTCYQAGYDSSTSSWGLGKRIAGTYTALGTYSKVYTAGQETRAKLVMNGSQISLELDGVTVIGPVTDTSITAEGYGGLKQWASSQFSSTVGLSWDNFSVDTIEAGSASSQITATTDDVTASFTASVSPIAQITATTEDTTFSGGSSTGAASAQINATTDDAVFSGTATGDTSSGTITTPALKNNTGTVLASLSGWTVNVYNTSTGALVVQKTGLSTNAFGVLTITDTLIVAGTSYAYEPVHATYGRRLPLAAAA